METRGALAGLHIFAQLYRSNRTFDEDSLAVYRNICSAALGIGHSTNCGRVKPREKLHSLTKEKYFSSLFNPFCLVNASQYNLKPKFSDAFVTSELSHSLYSLHLNDVISEE